jgi:3-phosphoshikimate 1-carboxyvinyltransferase
LDELPLVAVLGAVADGVTEIRDAAELKVKESDRITSTVGMINAIGGSAEPTSDGFIVTGGKRFRGGRVDPGGDHRIAMAAATAAAASDDDIEIDDDDVVAVSWPGFYEVLERSWS